MTWVKPQETQKTSHFEFPGEFVDYLIPAPAVVLIRPIEKYAEGTQPERNLIYSAEFLPAELKDIIREYDQTTSGLDGRNEIQRQENIRKYNIQEVQEGFRMQLSKLEKLKRDIEEAMKINAQLEKEGLVKVPSLEEYLISIRCA